MNAKEDFIYLYEHQQCKSYEREGVDSLVEIVELQEGQIYERNQKEPEIAFICRGHISFSLGGKPDEIVEKGKLVLLPPGFYISARAMTDSCIYLCKLTGEIRFCESFRLEELYKYVRPGKESFHPLMMKNPVIRFLGSFIPCIQDGLLCRYFIYLKVNEFMLLLRTYYTREELAGFFSPLLGPDLMFRNYVYRNVATVRSVKELAADAHMSERGFLKRFKRVMDCTPVSFMNRQKAEKIRHELLYTHTPIKEISDKYGFSTVQAFTAFCRKNLQNTPARIRKENSFSE